MCDQSLNDQGIFRSKSKRISGLKAPMYWNRAHGVQVLSIPKQLLFDLSPMLLSRNEVRARCLVDSVLQQRNENPDFH